MKKMETELLFLSTSTVGKSIGVNRKTIIRAIECGAIDAITTPGGHYRISSKEFYRYRTERMGIVI